MAVLEQVYQFTTSVLGEVVRRVGSKTSTVSLTVDGLVFDTNVVIADNYEQKTLWQSGDGGVTSFDHLLFLASADVFLEIANTATSPDERMIVFVPANALVSLPSRYVGAYVSDTSRLDGVEMVEATDYDEITEIRVQRNAADLEGDATIRLVLID